jgi:hypothetical protein
MSFTLNEEGAKRLNAMLRQLGYKNVNFQPGDRVTLAMDAKGNIMVASGRRGAEIFWVDRQHIEKGKSYYAYDKHIEEKIYEKGKSHYVYDKYIKEEIYLPNVRSGIFRDSKGNLYYGVFYYGESDKGNQKIVAGNIKDVISFEIKGWHQLKTATANVSSPVIRQGYMTPDGTIVYEKQSGGKSVTIDTSRNYYGGINFYNFLNEEIRKNFGDSAATLFGQAGSIARELSQFLSFGKVFTPTRGSRGARGPRGARGRSKHEAGPPTGPMAPPSPTGPMAPSEPMAPPSPTGSMAPSGPMAPPIPMAE